MKEWVHIARQACVLVLFAFLLGVTANALSPNPLSLHRVTVQERVRSIAAGSDPTAREVPLSTEETPLQEVTLEEAYQLFRDPGVVFLDARSPDLFEHGHIEGALSLPHTDFEEYYDKLFWDLEGKTLVTYCDGAECEASYHLAEALYRNGHQPVKIFFEGWPQWSSAGYPIAEGLNP